MLLAALNDKARSRGAVGFAADLFELGVASAAIATGLVAGAVVVLPVLVLEYVTEGRKAARCDAGCAGDRAPCTHGERKP